jgi:putative sterol carrier protein
MEVNLILEQLSKQAGNVSPFGAKLKFLIDDQHIMIDGHNGNAVSIDEGDADCVIITSSEHLLAMKNGDLNPMMAVLTGKIKIKGDKGLAMKLQSLIG